MLLVSAILDSTGLVSVLNPSVDSHSVIFVLYFNLFSSSRHGFLPQNPHRKISKVIHI